MPAGGADARDTPEVPYHVPAIGREDTQCPICHLSFKTPYHLRQHMDVHRGEQFPCGNCDKMLVMRHMLRDHEKGCVGGTKYQCSQCNKEYSTKQGCHQHERAKHRPDAPAPDEVFVCPHSGKQYNIKKSMQEHVTTCSKNPNRKGPFHCQVEGCKLRDHPFSCIKNLNAHLASCHRWKERKQ